MFIFCSCQYHECGCDMSKVKKKTNAKHYIIKFQEISKEFIREQKSNSLRLQELIYFKDAFKKTS